MAGLKDKVVVITGGSSGIGAAAAVEFAKHGAKLVITGRNQAALEDVAKRCLDGGAPEVEQIISDLNVEEGVEAVVSKTLERFGTVHVLVNNAGSTYLGDMRSTKGSAALLDETYKLTLRTPFQLCGFFVEELIKNKGNIVNISSVSAMIASPSEICYGIMKAGINYMTQCLAIELGMQGVRVNAVSPGMVETGILRKLEMSKDKEQEVFKSIADSVHALERKMIMPEDVAKMIVFLASDDAGKITGVNIPVDSGAVHTSPYYDFATAMLAGTIL